MAKDYPMCGSLPAPLCPRFGNEDTSDNVCILCSANYPRRYQACKRNTANIFLDDTDFDMSDLVIIDNMLDTMKFSSTQRRALENILDYMRHKQ